MAVAVAGLLELILSPDIDGGQYVNEVDKKLLSDAMTTMRQCFRHWTRASKNGITNATDQTVLKIGCQRPVCINKVLDVQL